MSKPITVYVPKPIVPGVLYHSAVSLKDYLLSSAHFDDDGTLFTPANEFKLTEKGLLTETLLEQNLNCYVHTPEELLELKKKWCKEAFQSGYNFCMDGIHAEVGNKETYVNNLTIE